jgi:hypothetical protein
VTRVGWEDWPDPFFYDDVFPLGWHILLILLFGVGSLLTYYLATDPSDMMPSLVLTSLNGTVLVTRFVCEIWAAVRRARRRARRREHLMFARITPRYFEDHKPR